VDGLAPPVDDALDLELLQHLFQPDAVAALNAEGAGNLALADLAGSVRDVGDDLLAGGQAWFCFGLSWHSTVESFRRRKGGPAREHANRGSHLRWVRNGKLREAMVVTLTTAKQDGRRINPARWLARLDPIAPDAGAAPR
jgi:hypothetical protein